MTNSLVKWLNYDMVCAPKAYISFINANQFHHTHIIFSGIKIYHVPSSLFTRVLYALIYQLQSMTYAMVLLAQWREEKKSRGRRKRFSEGCEVWNSIPTVTMNQNTSVTSFHSLRPRKYIDACIYSFIQAPSGVILD